MATWPAPVSSMIGGEYNHRYGVEIREVPKADAETLRPYWTPYSSVSSATAPARTGAGDSGLKTLTVTGGGFFTNTATDTGKLVTINGVGSYVVDTVASPTVAVMKTAFSDTFSAKTFTMTGNSVYPGETGIWAARMLEGWNERCPGKSSMRRIRLVYKTPRIRTVLVEDATKGFLEVAGSAERSALITEEVGSPLRTIEGPQTKAVTDNGSVDKACVVTWKHIGGAPNVDPRGPTRLILSHAAATINATTLDGYKMKVNSVALTNLGAGIGTLMFVDWKVSHTFDPTLPWMEYDEFVYRASGWADAKARAYMRAIVDAYPMTVTADSEVMTWAATAKASMQTIKAPGITDVANLNVTGGTQDFTTYDNLLGWL